MTIHVNWYNANKRKILYWRIDGYFSVPALYDTFDRVHALMSAVPHGVDHIVDLTEAAAPPDGFIAAIRSRHEKARRNDSMAFVVTCKSDWRSLVVLADPKVYRHGRYHVTTSIDEAKGWIHRRRAYGNKSNAGDD